MENKNGEALPLRRFHKSSTHFQVGDPIIELQTDSSGPSKKKPIRYAFIDSQNVHLAIKEQGWQLDFGRFRKYLADKYHVSKAFLFIGYLEKNQPLYENLRRQGYDLILKHAILLKNGKTKGNVDAELVLQALIEFPNYDEAVIASGDGDFYCLIQYLKNKGKLAKLLIPNQKKFSSLLREFIRSNDVAFMNNLRGKLEYR